MVVCEGFTTFATDILKSNLYMTMRKLFFMAVFVVTGLTASAQESNDYLPDGILTLEWKFNPFDYESKPTNMAMINGRLFLDYKSAIRFGVGVGYNKDKDEQKKDKDSRQADANNYDIENSNTITTNKEMSLRLSLGYEYHLASSGRLDFYVGAEAGYLGRFYSATKETNGDAINVSTVGTTTTTTRSTDYDKFEYKKSNSDRTKFNESGFFGTVFTGVDFYIYKKLYLGAELGITFNTGKKMNGTYTESKSKVSYEGSNQTANWTEDYSSELGVTMYVDNLNKKNNKLTYDYAVDNTGNYTKIYIEPAIRIGWMF